MTLYEFMWVEDQVGGPRLMMAVNGEVGIPAAPIYAQVRDLGLLRFDYVMTIMGRAVLQGSRCPEAECPDPPPLILAPLENGGVPLWHTLNKERFYRRPRRKGESCFQPYTASPPPVTPSAVEPVAEGRESGPVLPHDFDGLNN
ncbi:hypothetical protein [Xanthobacter versatilis]|uniref:hypothetical protein n=1 Tax=Xanthobacter autotrophicus (strain ATCC BAA-1158 / Py2) TaxID=78245 RepID=UPI0037289DB9